MFIIVETFDKTFPIIVSNSEGFPLIFDTEEEAKAYEDNNCQCGIIVSY